MWNAGGIDMPVKVTGYLGEMNGQHYVSIAGSKTGIPASSLTPIRKKRCSTLKERSTPSQPQS